MIWASDEGNLFVAMVMVRMQAERARKKYLDIHSKARDTVHKYILIEDESYAYFCLLRSCLCSGVFFKGPTLQLCLCYGRPCQNEIMWLFVFTS